ncbi:MAG: prepilin peptidase [Clostridia bacterium]|nr:prepilin peptidase [Clostridia bacterium]
MDLDAFYLIVTYVLAGVLGLCIGSFLNVLIYRLPRGMNIAKPASHCPECNYKLKWYDNIPVLSYIILKGKCRNCGCHISFRYTVVEVLCCLLWIACVPLFYSYGVWVVAIACIAVSALIVIFFSDLETLIVPDSMVITIGLCGLALLILEIFGLGAGIGWADRLIGLAVGFGFFALFYFGCLLILKKEGMGFGDVKLAGVCGLLLGWKAMALCIFIAAVVAGFAILIQWRASREKGKQYAYAPYISAAAIFCLFFGEKIIELYLTLLGF